MARTKASQLPLFPLLGEPLALDFVNTVVRCAPARVGGTELVDLINQPYRWGQWLDYQRPRLQPLLGGELTEHMRTPDCLDRIRVLRDAARVVINAARTAPSQPANPMGSGGRALIAASPPESPAGLPAEAAMTSAALGRPGREAYAARLDTEALLGALTTATIELATSAEVRTIRECQAPDCDLLFLPRRTTRRWCSSWTCGNRARAARYYQH